jgi:3-oxoacyl-[acyl-carrier protein] reductase
LEDEMGAVRTTMSQDHQVAVVTGGASGIGRAAAYRLAKDGFSVAVLDRDDAAAQEVARGIKATGGTSLALRVDVSSATEVEHAFAHVVTDMGTPFVLVNSAGILHIAPSLELSHVDWRRVLDVNLTGTFLCAQAAARTMVAAGRGGRIVNFGEVQSPRRSQGQSPFCALPTRATSPDPCSSSTVACY